RAILGAPEGREIGRLLRLHGQSGSPLRPGVFFLFSASKLLPPAAHCRSHHRCGTFSPLMLLAAPAYAPRRLCKPPPPPRSSRSPPPRRAAVATPTAAAAHCRR
ncbi:unnamed protein product, partial [Phaeothamnion confervicola]